MKTFFGGNFIKEEMLSEAGIYHPIKLEYYKRINEDEILKENYVTPIGLEDVICDYAKEIMI